MTTHFNHIRVFLGGSFDPVHLGHQTMAKTVYQKLQRHFPNTPLFLSFLPTAGNPLKSAPTPAHHRLNMLKLITKDTPFCIDTLEISQKPPIFTIDTVKQLKSRYINDWLIFIVGQDSLVNFHHWKDAYNILNHVQFWAFKRQSDQNNQVLADTLQHRITHDFMDFSQHVDKIFWDDTPIPNISSSQIRTYLKQNPELAKPFLSPSVITYIKIHQLYQNIL